jgi:hypothetical protein
MAEDWFGKQRAVWEQRLDRLESYVEGMKKEGAKPRSRARSASLSSTR